MLRLDDLVGNFRFRLAFLISFRYIPRQHNRRETTIMGNAYVRCTERSFPIARLTLSLKSGVRVLVAQATSKGTNGVLVERLEAVAIIVPG